MLKENQKVVLHKATEGQGKRWLSDLGKKAR